jgi:hypothetical protein
MKTRKKKTGETFEKQLTFLDNSTLDWETAKACVIDNLTASEKWLSQSLQQNNENSEMILRQQIMHKNLQWILKTLDDSTHLGDLMEEQKSQLEIWSYFNSEPFLKGIEMPKVMEMASRLTQKKE